MHTLLIYAQKTISMFPKSLQSDMTTSIRHVKWSCKNDKKIVLKCTSFDEFCPTASFYWMENFWILFQRWWIAHLAEMQFSPLCSFKLLHFGKDLPSSLQSTLSKIQTKPLYISTEGPATHFWDWAKPNIYSILYSTQMNYCSTYGEDQGI